jgi:hypothetical protein
MARLELPSKQADGSPNWIEYRDALRALDRFAVQEVVNFEIDDSTGKRKANFYVISNDMRNALLGRIITAWSYPAPIPSKNSFQAADIVIGETMNLEDYAALEEAIQPLMDLINGTREPDPKKQSES